MLSKPAGKIQFYVATDGQTDGHITTAKPALMHGVYGGKTIMIQENDMGFGTRCGVQKQCSDATDGRTLTGFSHISLLEIVF